MDGGTIGSASQAVRRCDHNRGITRVRILPRRDNSAISAVRSTSPFIAAMPWRPGPRCRRRGEHPRAVAHLWPSRRDQGTGAGRQRPRSGRAVHRASGHGLGLDLGQNRLNSFSAYRFLYERLIGAGSRPWLPGAFCAAASLPHLHPERRRALLQSISEAAATAPGWSTREPTFYPEWVEKIDIDKQPN